MEAYKNREAKWDNVKMVLIILVVIGHMMKSDLEIAGFSLHLYYFIYLFHMPAFIFLSGLFSKSAINKRNYDRVLSFFLLYLFVKFLGFFTTLIVTGRDSVRIFTESGTAWYALVICIYYLMTMFLKRYRRGYVLLWSIVLGCIAGYSRDIGNFLALSRVFTFYPFFLMGYYAKPDQLKNVSDRKWVKLLSAVILLLFFALSARYASDLSWTITLLKGNTTYRKLAYFPEWGGLYRLLQYLVAALLTFCVIAVIPSKRGPLTYIGQRTRAVYAFHWAFIKLFYEVLGGDAWARSVWPAHYQVLFLLVAVVIALLTSLKPFELLIDRLIVPRKEENHE
jgi:fucose 4-O-acetylase-like acetyltransferase